MKRSGVFGAVVLGSSMLAAGGLAHADELACAGNVLSVLVYSDGRMMTITSYRGDYMSLCSTQGTWNNVDTSTCMTWYSMLMTAKKEGKTVTVFHNGVPAGVTCATLGTYGNTPPVVYVMVNQ